MAQWNRNTVPKCDVGKYSDEVLATVEHIGCDGKIYRRVIKAVYFPYHHCTVEDIHDRICDEYCKWPSQYPLATDDEAYNRMGEEHCDKCLVRRLT